MKKSEFIAKYGEEAWQKKLEHTQAWRKEHREELNAHRREQHKAHREADNACARKWWRENSGKQKAHNRETNRKGGKYYERALKSQTAGLRGARNIIRNKHRRQWKQYKDIIAPESQIHHEWIPKTDEYRGVALVEAEPHRYGIIDVIEILDGNITLLTEEEIKKKGGKDMDKEKKIGGTVTAWGLRLAVPAGVIKGIGLVLQDDVEWAIEERKGKKVAVLSKKEASEG